MLGAPPHRSPGIVSMTRRSPWRIFALPGLLVGAIALATVASGDDDRPFRFAYYLFELPKETRGCGDCYIPLVLARDPIEQSPKQRVAFIVTYERDSIWSAKEDLVEIDAGAGEPSARSARQMRLQGRTYRYQLVANEEAIRLLEKPLGQIPIHRPAGTGITEAWRLRLLRDLRGGG